MYSSIECIGNTPIVELPLSLASCNARVLIKLEEYNWGGSIKSRVGYQMIIDAEKVGRINSKNPSSVVIIEATGGNTGIGIAQLCAIRGYNCVLVVPDNYSEVRVEMLRQFGAQIKRSNHYEGNDSHIKLAIKICQENPQYIHLDQFNNPSNVKAHYISTGREIVAQIPDGIDAFVSCIGSGGTITGCGRAIRERYPNSKIVAVQPTGCDVLRGTAIPHIVQGTTLGILPTILDSSIIDEVVEVDEIEIRRMLYDLPRATGLYLGYSSLANIIAAIKLGKKYPFMKTIATISPDGGRNYHF